MSDYDDSILNTTEDLSKIDWDNLEGFRLPVGKYLIKFKLVLGQMFNFKEYTGPRAKLKMEVQDGPHKGQIQYDDINLPHHAEKDGNKKRRVLIASRLGLIPKGAKDTKSVNWKDLQEKLAIIDVVLQEYTDKDGNKKETTKVDFAGYESAENWPGWEAANSGNVTNVSNGNGSGAAKEAWNDI